MAYSVGWRSWVCRPALPAGGRPKTKEPKAVSRRHETMTSRKNQQGATLDPRGRKVKILATLGPASRDPEMIAKLIRAGADASAST
jgi:proline racemase